MSDTETPQTEQELEDARYEAEAQAEEEGRARDEALFRAAPRARHQLKVTLSARWSLDFTLTCQGDSTSVCHLWREVEDRPGTVVPHEECSVIDWFNDDRQLFVLESYVGPDAPGLVSGPIDVIRWGEDGAEWQYAVAEATEWPVGSLAL